MFGVGEASKLPPEIDKCLKTEIIIMMIWTYIFPIFTFAASALIVWFLFVNRNQTIRVKVRESIDELESENKPVKETE